MKRKLSEGQSFSPTQRQTLLLPEDKAELMDSVYIGTPQFRVAESCAPSGNAQEGVKQLIKLRREFSFGINPQIDILANVEVVQMNKEKPDANAYINLKVDEEKVKDLEMCRLSYFYIWSLFITFHENITLIRGCLLYTSDAADE
eukprot:TRINITY_DN7198_c0_g1_i1.p1 TRINITY_DN7198_c0_g1~~TRINITY_DN7198_c0_g1_i1.p1  ORF type:complete len:145 (+),score=27.57 TRINITY_DN7198_c0_g1_i1:927-1361(+)